jgi:hypothetical protein
MRTGQQVAQLKADAISNNERYCVSREGFAAAATATTSSSGGAGPSTAGSAKGKGKGKGKAIQQAAASKRARGAAAAAAGSSAGRGGRKSSTKSTKRSSSSAELGEAAAPPAASTAAAGGGPTASKKRRLTKSAQSQPEEEEEHLEEEERAPTYALVMLTFRRGGELLHSLAVAEVLQRSPGSIAPGVRLHLLRPALLGDAVLGAVRVKDVAVLAEPLLSVAHLVDEALASMSSSSSSSSSSATAQSQTSAAVTDLVRQHLCLHLSSQDPTRRVTSYTPRPTPQPAAERGHAGLLVASLGESTPAHEWLRGEVRQLGDAFTDACKDGRMLAVQTADSLLLASTDGTRGMKPIAVSAC